MLGRNQAQKHEEELARLADEDSIASPDGLHGTLEPILSWLHDDELRGLRKKRLGRHRAFFAGRHTDCHYRLFYLKMYKREETDREEDKVFQSKILRALSPPETRTLEPPPQPEEEE